MILVVLLFIIIFLLCYLPIKFAKSGRKSAEKAKMNWHSYVMMGKSFQSVCNDLGTPSANRRNVNGQTYYEWTLRDSWSGAETVLAGYFNESGICFEESHGEVVSNWIHNIK